MMASSISMSGHNNLTVTLRIVNSEFVLCEGLLSCNNQVAHGVAPILLPRQVYGQHDSLVDVFSLSFA